jgi:hypothetical protein
MTEGAMLEQDSTRRARSGAFAGTRALTADLWFFWDSDHPHVEVQLVTINGTIAGVYPRTVSKGELLPVHRRFVPLSGKATCYLRLRAPGSSPITGLSVAVELRDGLGRARSLPICQVRPLDHERFSTIEANVEIPEDLV